MTLHNPGNLRLPKSLMALHKVALDYGFTQY
jgi:hypothetical protein